MTGSFFLLPQIGIAQNKVDAILGKLSNVDAWTTKSIRATVHFMLFVVFFGFAIKKEKKDNSQFFRKGKHKSRQSQSSMQH